MIIAKLMRLSGEYRRPLIMGAILRIVDGLFSLGPVLVLFAVLRDVAAEHEMPSAAKVGVLLAAIVLVRFVIHWLALRTSVRAGFSIMSLLRTGYADRLRRLPMGWLSGASTGDVTGPLLQDLQHIEPFLVEHLAASCSVAVQILFCISCVAVMDRHLALLVLAGLFPAALSMVWVNRRLAKRMPGRSQALSDVTSAIIEFSRGINVVKAFGVTAGRFQKYEGVMAHNRDINMTLITYVGVAAFFYFICLELGYAVLVAFGFPAASPGATADPAPFAAFLFTALVALRVYGLAATFVDLAGFVKQGDAALERLEAIDNVKLLPQPACERFPKNKDVIFNRVSFSYGEAPVLQDVSFTMAPGAMTALVGASGSGKTTVANLLCRFWDAQAGSVSIGGVDVRDMNEETLWKHVSIVFQNVHLFSDTVAANIRLGAPEASDEAVQAAARAARCHEFIMELPKGYDTVLADGASDLSGGQRQRLSIARAILKDAPIIVLDEATASVDLENERHIQQAIGALTKEKTLLVIAHRLSTVVNADQILVLHGGKVTERGTHAELLALTGRYSELWSAQYEKRRPA